MEMITAMCCLGILAQRAAVRDQFKVGIEQHVGQLCPPGSGTTVEAGQGCARGALFDSAIVFNFLLFNPTKHEVVGALGAVR